MTWSTIALALGAFAVMEPITAATHRWVMHGFGEFLHRSHHVNRPANRRGGPPSHGSRPERRRAALRARLERNDWYPVVFAAIVNMGFVAGFNLDGFAPLVPVGIGVTAYGAAYALVHDVYIHRRLGWFDGREIAVFERLAQAHRIHHLYNAAPYGMLVPVVPPELRERAATTERNPFASA